MKAIFNTVNAMLATAALLTFGLANSAIACGGNNCQPGSYEEIGAHIWGVGEYGAIGESHNGTSGPANTVGNRKTLSESDGFMDIYVRGALDKCADCEGNNLGVNVQGAAFQRNYSAIETSGPNSGSAVRGAAALEGAAGASRWSTVSQ
ncbi:hypothetical protein KC850_02305 [Candidatus Kaiserbacteria bacterium]|nr:hypothetical protein [Candidatus Kaiserbacteria bacterium]